MAWNNYRGGWNNQSSRSNGSRNRSGKKRSNAVLKGAGRKTRSGKTAEQEMIAAWWIQRGQGLLKLSAFPMKQNGIDAKNEIRAENGEDPIDFTRTTRSGHTEHRWYVEVRDNMNQVSFRGTGFWNPSTMILRVPAINILCSIRKGWCGRPFNRNNH